MEEEIERLSAEHARLSDQLITAEQEERRRLALFLHDGPVQSMAGIALMLDAVIAAVDEGRDGGGRTHPRARRSTSSATRSARFVTSPSSSSRSCSATRASSPPCRALADQLGMSNRIQIDLDVEAAEALAEHAQVAIFQIIREALHQAIRRGPPTRVSVAVAEAPVDGIEAVIVDDAPGERRRASFDAIEERARSLSGRMTVDPGPTAAPRPHRLSAVPRASLNSRPRWPRTRHIASSSRSRRATSSSTARASRRPWAASSSSKGRARWIVNRISASPLPQDRRPCAYLLPTPS